MCARVAASSKIAASVNRLTQQGATGCSRAGCRAVGDSTLVAWYPSLYAPRAREGRMTVTIGRRELLVALGGAAGRLATNPGPTGSATITNTIGIVRVSRCSAAVPGVHCARITSGCRATNSFAKVRVRFTSPPPQRTSIRRLRPSVQPLSARPCVNWESWIFPSGSLSSALISTPMRRMCSGCCRAAECSQQFPPSDGDCHTPLPREVRRGRIARHERAVPNNAARGVGGAS